MTTGRLRVVAITGPLVYLFIVEGLSIFVLVPLMGHRSVSRLLLVAAILVIGTVPFSIWLFATLERLILMTREISERKRVEAEYRAIFEATGDGLVIYRMDGTMVAANSAFCSMNGYSRKELLGQSVTMVIHPDSHALFREFVRTIVRGGSIYARAINVRKDGSTFPVDVHGTVMVYDGALHILGVARDATETVRAYELLEQRVEERTRELSTLLDVSHHVTSILELRPLLNLILDQLMLVTEYDGAVLFRLDGDHLSILARRAPGQGESTSQKNIALSRLGPVWDALGSGRTVVVDDMHGDEPLTPPYQEAVGGFIGTSSSDVRSWMAVPLVVQDRTIGAVGLCHSRPGYYTAHHAQLTAAIASQAAVAIENARLYDEVRNARDRLQVWNAELEAKVAERTRDIERYSQELTSRVLQAQEAERKRIARELHDDTAQTLSSLLIGVDVLESHIPHGEPSLRDEFDRVRGMARRALDSTRALAHGLRPTILDDFGLDAALEWIGVDHTRTFGVPVTVAAEEISVDRLGPEVELALFRIAQEALTNSGRHAGASSLHVTLSSSPGAVELVVEDDGKGFDMQSLAGPSPAGGLGLHGIEERVQLLGASLDVRSALGEGTRIAVTVPLPDGKARLDRQVAAAGIGGSV